MFYFGRNDRFIPRHRGPYQVLHIAGPIYTMQDLVQDNVVVTHIQKFRPFYYDEERPNLTRTSE